MKTYLPYLLLPAFSCLLPGLGFAQSHSIVLRNGTRLDPVEAVQVDEDGIRLKSGQIIQLDKVLSAQVQSQQKLDDLLTGYGDALFRIRVRLIRRDFENLQKPLAVVLSRYSGRTSESSLLVHLARVHHSRGSGDFASAYHSLLHIHRLTREKHLADFHDDFSKNYLGGMSLNRNGFSPWLSVGGWNSDDVKDNWPVLVEDYRSLRGNYPQGMDFYFFLMAEQAGQLVDAKLRSRRIKLDESARLILKSIRSARQEKPDPAEMKKVLTEFNTVKPDPNATEIEKAIFLFSKGSFQVHMERKERTEGLLNLLTVHAKYRQAAPAIAAESLVVIAKILAKQSRNAEAERVKKELFTFYPSSVFAKRFKLDSPEKN